MPIGKSSAKDKMILEEAYRSNPKPDKQARQDIVDRVSLNEKEVQVCLAPITPPQRVDDWMDLGLGKYGRDETDNCRFGSRTAAKTTEGNRVHFRPRSSPLFALVACTTSPRQILPCLASTRTGASSLRIRLLRGPLPTTRDPCHRH